MSEKFPLNEGYKPIKDGHQPASKPAEKSPATGGYQPIKFVGEQPTNSPPPKKR